MFEFLEKLDRSLLIFYNSLNTPFLDSLMWFLSDKYVWIPLYIAIAAFFIYKAGWVKGGIWILAASLTFAITDPVSVHLFKDVFQRYRPSQNLEIHHLLHYVNHYHGGLYGFVSSHAANTFGLATISYLLIRKKWYGWIIFIWAALVSFSRTYLGVHYPADIACGALLGVVSAYFVYFIYKLLPNKFSD